MNDDAKIFEWVGWTIALVTFIGCYLFYNSNADESYYSIIAAFLSAMMVWMSYIIIRMLVIAMRKR